MKGLSFATQKCEAAVQLGVGKIFAKQGTHGFFMNIKTLELLREMRYSKQFSTKLYYKNVHKKIISTFIGLRSH